MLVLTRKPGERIIIGDGTIKIVCLGVNEYGEAKIGIEAPRNIAVNREEVLERGNGERQK